MKQIKKSNIRINDTDRSVRTLLRGRGAARAAGRGRRQARVGVQAALQPVVLDGRRHGRAHRRHGHVPDDVQRLLARVVHAQHLLALQRLLGRLLHHLRLSTNVYQCQQFIYFIDSNCFPHITE